MTRGHGNPVSCCASGGDKPPLHLGHLPHPPDVL